MGCVPPQRREEITNKDIASCITKPHTDSSPPMIASNDINQKQVDSA